VKPSEAKVRLGHTHHVALLLSRDGLRRRVIRTGVFPAPDIRMPLRVNLAFDYSREPPAVMPANYRRYVITPRRRGFTYEYEEA
jgi:hypothetical protein